MGHVRVFPFILLAIAVAAGCAKSEKAAVAASPEKNGTKSESAAPAEGGAARGGGNGGRRGGRSGGGEKQAVEVTAISRRDLSETLNVVGSLAANEIATIKPEMNGLIRSIHFEEGQRVKKGDLLVKIDDSELQAQLAQSKARHDLARQNLERAENLRKTQSNTQADVDRARSEYAAAEADVALLNVRLARTDVKAPFDGFVQGRTLSPGDYVNTQAIITTISDLSRIKVEFQVPERYVAKVKRGTPFIVKPTTAEANASGHGEVYFVNSVIDRATRSSEVKGYLENPSPALKAGMFAFIEIVLEVRKDALTVPEGAILMDQRGPQVVTVVDQKGEKVAGLMPVSLGLRAKGLVEVTPMRGEFADKQLIVAAGVGSLALFPGARLDPRPLREEFQIGN